jgi:ubiquinol-cytochrome c reductase iron-sulfur subunit
MKDNEQKRRVLTFALGGVFGGGVVAAAIPFAKSMWLSAEKFPPTKEIDITKLGPGQILAEHWLGKPLYVLKRTRETLDRLQRDTLHLADSGSSASTQPLGARNPLRSITPEIFVAWSVCTHLGCAVAFRGPGSWDDFPPEYHNGVFYCPCHSSAYDLAGRVWKGMPAPRNLEIPNYEIIDGRIVRLTALPEELSNKVR